MNDYFKRLNAEPQWRKAIAELGKSARPIVPEYTVCQSVEERQTLIENIKIKTGERKGFDLLFQLLTGESPS
ncbi:hypothetical protein [Caudoviricetes sp.]|nr:hypothetical protein [Caudoviricetes sp.]